MQNKFIIDGKVIDCIILATEVFNPQFLIHKLQLPNGDIRYCPVFGTNSEVGIIVKPPPKL